MKRPVPSRPRSARRAETGTRRDEPLSAIRRIDAGSMSIYSVWKGSMAPIPTLRVLVFQDESTDLWVAQALEIDLAAQGDHPLDALRSLGRTLAGQALADQEVGNVPFRSLEPAPAQFWRRFEKAMRLNEELPVERPWRDAPAPFVIAPRTELRLSV